MPKQTRTTTRSKKTAASRTKKPAKRAPRKPVANADLSTSVLGGASRGHIAATFLRRGR